VPFLNYGGLLADDAETSRVLLDKTRGIAMTFRASYVELRHARRQFTDLPARQHKIGLTLGLPGTVGQLWNDVDRKVRNQVRKAQKSGLTPVEGGRELVDEFYAVFARNMRDLGTPVYTKRLFQSTLAEFGERARVFVVRSGVRPVAAAVAIAFRDTVVVPWASSLREFRNECPNMLLYWAMLEQSVEHGRRVFDFGRSSPGTGAHQFKRQWGARETSLFWEYVLLTRSSVPDHGPANPRFTAAIDVWKRCPLWLANAVGPHIVRGIP
jgi:FemAB-related protein (PEP-CTERM system-associated)